jgi:proteasome lid subunit RPN8/RPN11
LICDRGKNPHPNSPRGYREREELAREKQADLNMRRVTRNAFVEESWTLVGERRGPLWYARRVRPTSGDPASVAFDGAWALRREERRGDVVGFLHTHPAGFPRPSARDLRTMRAWCGAFGKPLLCVIVTAGRAVGYRFDDDESCGLAVERLELFGGGVVVGWDPEASGEVDPDGEQQAASRGAVPRRGSTGKAARRAGRAVRGRRAGV